MAKPELVSPTLVSIADQFFYTYIACVCLSRDWVVTGQSALETASTTPIITDSNHTCTNSGPEQVQMESHSELSSECLFPVGVLRRLMITNITFDLSLVVLMYRTFKVAQLF